MYGVMCKVTAYIKCMCQYQIKQENNISAWVWRKTIHNSMNVCGKEVCRNSYFLSNNSNYLNSMNLGGKELKPELLWKKVS